jgi:zinc protease
MKKKLLLGIIFIAFFSLPRVSGALIRPNRSVLNNGLILLTSEQRSLPMVSIEFLIQAGARYDPPQQAGLANLTTRLLTYGTQRRSALQISETLDFIGARLSTGCGMDLVSVSLTILKKDLAKGLELLADIMTGAAFPEAEIERRKQSIIASIRAKEENPGAIAQKRFLAALYPDSPFGRPTEGSEESVKAIPRASLSDFYLRYFRPNRSIISIVGDISHQEMAQTLNEAFRSWHKGEAPQMAVVPRVNGSAQIIRVNKDLTQANIILGHRGVGRENPDYYALQVMNYILGGGGFSSRAMDSIRNERGLAYSVYSFFDADKSRGTFEFVMQTKNESAREAIRIAKDEIRRIREQPVSEQELNDAKDYLTGSFPLRLDTNHEVAAFLAHVEFFDLGLDYPDRYPDLIRNLTRDDISRVAEKYLDPESLVTVLVGNQKKIGDN